MPTCLLAGLLGVGCTTAPDARKTRSQKADPKNGKAAPPPGPEISPVNALSGRVILVNGPLKYLVAEGTLGRLPTAEQVLNAYRDGQRVGEVRVSQQARGANFTADILQGEVRVGDTLRSD
ncbi:MAG: hypothetical protein B9S33_05750 [Pedosphaera sp. Tous-C6FEB]|nr:MAG: hypothetical protein B9S33_05750 [Pedosphaera sp. Tous-C6FEB]